MSDIGDFIDVDLVECSLGVLFAIFGDDGGDDLAGAAPDGEAIEDDELVFWRREDVFLVGLFAADVSDAGLDWPGGGYVLSDVVDRHFEGGWSKVVEGGL